MEKEHNQNTEENTSLDEDADKIETTDGNQTSDINACLLYTSPSPRDGLLSRMPSSA